MNIKIINKITHECNNMALNLLLEWTTKPTCNIL